ncbi:MAG: flavin-dependent dehydrogenase [Candidatus Paceibacteria bacterium]|jgi:flavin-dependent dehydrogenase
MIVEQQYDAIVIGAGPAGASAAAILAEKGRRVALVERNASARYSVGESMIPFCWYPLERLGLVERLDKSGFVIPKHSVQFAGQSGRVSKPFYFFDHTDHACARTWQVVRQDFDELLRNNAQEKGAELLLGTTVKEFLRDVPAGAATQGAVSGVRALRENGDEVLLRAPITIDASGRDTFSQVNQGWRVRDRTLHKHAIWTYYKGALRDEGVDEGTTTIAYLPEKGWFWYIPLVNDIVGVGLVADKGYLYREKGSSEEIFEREVQLQEWIRERLLTGRRVEDFRVTSDFSYRSKHCAADGLVLAGDAFSFLDPVFSSGIYFALWSGVMAADAVDAALAAGDTSAARFEAYGEHFRRQVEPMRRLVYAFYDGDFNFGNFLQRFPDFRSDLTDCLIGDLDRDFDPFFAAVSEFATIPEPLPHGGPFMGLD